MIKRIRKWLTRSNKTVVVNAPEREYSREQLEKVYILGYNDGKRDGLSIAREQATKSLKEIVWQQNQKKNS
jgi:hypothetical protein